MTMDNDRFERRQRVYSTAKITGLLAGSAAAFIAFCLFQIFGAEILETAVWMFALGLMTFSGVFVATYLGVAASTRGTTVGS